MLDRGASVMDELVAAVDGLCAADPSSVDVVGLHRQLERLAAVATRAAAAFDAGGTWRDDGARSCAAWLSVRCGMPVE
ncbi:MAG TPA: hypothetical protein VF244_01530, partial [Acidimicrobiales bacterium]